MGGLRGLMGDSPTKKGLQVQVWESPSVQFPQVRCGSWMPFFLRAVRVFWFASCTCRRDVGLSGGVGGGGWLRLRDAQVVLKGTSHWERRPGSLFGLAANLGLGAGPWVGRLRGRKGAGANPNRASQLGGDFFWYAWYAVSRVVFDLGLQLRDIPLGVETRVAIEDPNGL